MKFKTLRFPEHSPVDSRLILPGDSRSGEPTGALQASELLRQTVDAKYPGPGKPWSPFALEKNVLFIGASDEASLDAGIARLVQLTGPGK